MNIAFLLTPKSETVTLKNTMTLRQAMEKMEYHKFGAVPVVDKNGKYVYTLSEGDILWYVKNHMDLNLRDAEKVHIGSLKRSRTIEAVSINASLEKVMDMTRFQNFVPVVDDSGIFIGLIRRSDIMENNLFTGPHLAPFNGQDSLMRA